jgi:hypothetical protein
MQRLQSEAEQMSNRRKELQQQPGRSWQSAAKSNRRGCAENKVSKEVRAAVAKAIIQAQGLREARAEGRRLRAEGGSAKRVINCPGCGCPVADSPIGRERHARRMPRCREAIGR